MTTIIPNVDKLRWHLENNVMPKLTPDTIDKIIAQCEAVNAGTLKLTDDIGTDVDAGVTVAEMLDDLKIEYSTSDFVDTDPKTFYMNWNNNVSGYTNLGGYETRLMEAYRVASSDNRRKLEKVYPEYFLPKDHEPELIQFSDRLHNHLVEVAANRAQEFGFKGQRARLHQQDVFIGAISAIDMLNGQIGISNGKSSITPRVYISFLRGEIVEKIEEGK